VDFLALASNATARIEASIQVEGLITPLGYVATATDSSNGYTLLLVDDDAIALMALKLFLGQKGHVVHCMESGAGLLGAVDRLQPDAVILDMHLPGDHGVALVQKLRDKHTVPIVMFTVDDDASRHVESLNCGADAFLVKGVDMSVVDATVRRLVARTADLVPAGDVWQLRSDNWHLYTPSGAEVRLTAGEFYLLSAFAGKGTDVVAREAILEAQGKPDTLSNLRNLDVYVARLRAKVLAQTRVELPVKAIYASGFAFTEPLDLV
jgi:DNA-binding response OmpR family regulator